jgi:hypothetical protein
MANTLAYNDKATITIVKRIMLHPQALMLKTFYSVTYAPNKEASVFISRKPFQPCQLCDEASSLPTWCTFQVLHCKGRLLY